MKHEFFFGDRLLKLFHCDRRALLESMDYLYHEGLIKNSPQNNGQDILDLTSGGRVIFWDIKKCGFVAQRRRNRRRNFAAYFMGFLAIVTAYVTIVPFVRDAVRNTDNTEEEHSTSDKQEGKSSGVVVKPQSDNSSNTKQPLPPKSLEKESSE